MIKAVLADALACHLDNFQRIVVDPCSISVVTYTETRPFVVRVNDLGGDVSGLIPPGAEAGAPGAEETSDAVVGGARPGRWTACDLGVVHRRSRGRPARRLPWSRARVIHVFRQPERFVAGTVGEPGDRSFYLQAIEEARTVSVLLEKQQVQVLAERITALLQEVARRFGADDPAGRRRSTTSTRSPCPSRRSSGSAPWGWAGTPTPAPSSSSCSP